MVATQFDPGEIRFWYETGDGIRVELASAEQHATAFSNFGAPDQQNITAVGVGQHGATLIDQFDLPRTLTLRLKRSACGCYGFCAGSVDWHLHNQTVPIDPDPADIFTTDTVAAPPPAPNKTCCGCLASWAYMINLFRCRKGCGKLHAEFCGNKRFIYVWPQAPQFGWDAYAQSQLHNGIEPTIRFYAPNPYWCGEFRRYEMTGEKVHAVEMVNCGTAIAYPTITISADKLGPSFGFGNELFAPTSILQNINNSVSDVYTYELSPDCANRPRKTITSAALGDITHTLTSTSVNRFQTFGIFPSPDVIGGINKIFFDNLLGSDIDVVVEYYDKHISLLI